MQPHRTPVLVEPTRLGGEGVQTTREDQSVPGTDRVQEHTPQRPAGVRSLDANSAGDVHEEALVERWVSRSNASSNLDRLSSLSAFVRRMERFDQLSQAEQVQLARIVRSGREASETIQAKKRPTENQIKKAKEATAQAERAAEMLVGSNFRLVLLICRELAEERHGRERAMDVMADLVGEANVALVEAIIGFDETRCPSFATYAARVVRDRVRAQLGKDGHIRLPPSWNRLKRIAAVRIPQLQTELGRQPTKDEIKADLLERCMAWAYSKLSPEQQALPEAKRTELMTAKLRKQGMFGAIESLDDVLLSSMGAASLDAQVGEDSGTTLGDLVSDAPKDDGFDAVDLSELRETLGRAIETLDDREKEILMLRYGFVDGEQWTYVMIGERFGVTAERIRQIERAVLGKLRSGDETESLESFL